LFEENRLKKRKIAADAAAKAKAIADAVQTNTSTSCCKPVQKKKIQIKSNYRRVPKPMLQPCQIQPQLPVKADADAKAKLGAAKASRC
jgi:hypothetical protein